MGGIVSSELQSPCQTPLVSGCVGCVLRAHAKTCGTRPRTISFLLRGSPLAYELSFPLSGSFHISHARMRESLANAPTTPTTYSLSLGYCDGSASTVAPGACTHPELCTPGMGGCCGPSFGNGSQQESKSTKMGLI